jgi:Uma2 family endonuclease
MALLVMDPEVERRLRAEREATGMDRRDEVWDGVYIASPLPDVEHQRLASQLWLVLHTTVEAPGLGIAINGLNVSDREEGWTENYREPDLAVFLRGNPARDCGTHYVGGPDLIIEIISPHDMAREKRPFYAQIGVRELLLLDRQPWALELYRLRDGQLVEVGRTDAARGDALVSEVVPLSFRLLPGEPRPRVEIVHRDGIQRWVI